MQEWKGQGIDYCSQDNDNKSTMGLRGRFTEILIRLQSLFCNCYLYKCVNLFLKTILIVNRTVHDPQRPHLDNSYSIEDYKKLTVDMVGKAKDLKIVIESLSIKSITIQLLFRYCIAIYGIVNVFLLFAILCIICALKTHLYTLFLQ